MAPRMPGALTDSAQCTALPAPAPAGWPPDCTASRVARTVHIPSPVLPSVATARCMERQQRAVWEATGTVPSSTSGRQLPSAERRCVLGQRPCCIASAAVVMAPAPTMRTPSVFDHSGNIYGTTSNGGAHGYGVVFELTHSGGTWTENVLWSFTGGDDGGSPLSGVIFDSAGNLYGTGVSGGAHGDGVVYELSPSQSGWTQTTLYSFSGADAPFPAGGVTMDANGNLYGTTGGPLGQGEAYELTQTSGNWSISRRQFFPSVITVPTILPPSMQQEISMAHRASSERDAVKSLR